jgi:hypothetical protein
MLRACLLLFACLSLAPLYACRKDPTPSPTPAPAASETAPTKDMSQVSHEWRLPDPKPPSCPGGYRAERVPMVERTARNAPLWRCRPITPTAGRASTPPPKPTPP